MDDQTEGAPALRGKGVRIARRSKRPSRAAPGSRAAAKLLTEEAVREGLRLDEAAIAALKACCSMRPPRNAVAIVGAIKARLEYSQPKPKQEIGLSGDVTYTLVDPFARKPQDG